MKSDEMKRYTRELDWLQDYIDGRITPENLDRLQKAIMEDSEFCRTYLIYMDTDTALHAMAADPVFRAEIAESLSEELAHAGAASIEGKKWKKTARIYRTVSWSALSLLVLLVATFVWVLAVYDHSVRQFAKSGSVDPYRPRQVKPVMPGAPAEWLDGDSKILKNRLVSSQPGGAKAFQITDVDLGDTGLTLRLPKGITVEFAPYAKAAFESAMRLRLFRGEVRVDVGKEGSGFTVVTDAGEVIDIGTVFKVGVKESGETHLDVLSGEINFKEHLVLENGAVPLVLQEGSRIVLKPRESVPQSQYAEISGIYPHLAVFNNAAQCYYSALAEWGGRLWVIGSPPYAPMGSEDKLYEIRSNLRRITRPESVGGTHSNRMIHRETGQLILGPYFIDANGNVRPNNPSDFSGRFCGTARHLEKPGEKACFATMEKGLYEIDLRTFEYRKLIGDDASKALQNKSNDTNVLQSQLPGTFGMGLYKGMDRLFYINSGDNDWGDSGRIDQAGASAQWKKAGEDWERLRSGQFGEVTGPRGIEGSDDPNDPVWALGMDHRSILLNVFDRGEWTAYRLPKTSHSYDGTHGLCLEQPRIRDIGSDDLLMSTHGSLWAFPRNFSLSDTSGIRPRSSVLKLIRDYCRWNGRVVFACNDTSSWPLYSTPRVETRPFPAGTSQSNLWFVPPEQLDRFGPVSGRGAVWLNDSVEAGKPSDPFIFDGFRYRSLHLKHDAAESVRFTLEVDKEGNGHWTPLREIEVAPGEYVWIDFDAEETGAWLRLASSRDMEHAVAVFQYRNEDRRTKQSSPVFDGVANVSCTKTNGGILYADKISRRTLWYLPDEANDEQGQYVLDANLRLRPDPGNPEYGWFRQAAAIHENVLRTDSASVIYEENGRRYRLPKSDLTGDATSDFSRIGAPWDTTGIPGPERSAREVVHGRDLLNAHGTFYELPTPTAGGISKIRPIATHNRRIKDFASYRGLLVLSGIAMDPPGNNPHIVRSDDGKCALWVGAIDDLWAFGKPRGIGGPWYRQSVKAGEASDPYLMSGYDKKKLYLSHTDSQPVDIRVEVDLTGNGDWGVYERFTVAARKRFEHRFPESFGAYWIRFVPERDTQGLSTLLLYE